MGSTECLLCFFFTFFRITANRLGEARGFRIDALTKMVTTKFTSNPRRNLLDFVVEHLAENAVEALQFPQQAGPFLLQVSKLSLYTVHQMLSELSSSVER